MQFLYTARESFDHSYNGNSISWDNYLKFSKLFHLKEVVSLDGMLNPCLVEPDIDNSDDWNFIHTQDLYQTDLFTSTDYVLKKMKVVDGFNFLMVVIEPEIECQLIPKNNFEFLGYDLMDQDFGISALTNCGGFDETFSPTDLNNYGLIDHLFKVKEIQKRLYVNNPEEYHADTSIAAIWRHLYIGKTS